MLHRKFKDTLGSLLDLSFLRYFQQVPVAFGLGCPEISSFIDINLN
jgi:hypothetical protein